MSSVDAIHDELDSRIEKYETMLDRNENDCLDKALISAILEELKELKDTI